MALVRCPECAAEISDKATLCPSCGAPVDLRTVIAAPTEVGFADENFTGTSKMLMELAKKAATRLNYRVDTADASAGTLAFTTGITMGSWSGVSGTITWEEIAPYQFRVNGQGKQNVKGGQVVAFNLFDEANSKAQNVIEEMKRMANGGSENEPPPSGCAILLVGMVFGTLFLSHAISQIA